MPNFMQDLKKEIARIAKRENKSDILSLAKKLAELKKSLIVQKKVSASLRDDLENLKKSAGMKTSTPQVPADVLAKSRLGGNAIKKLRGKLKLSRKLFGKLVGASQATVYLWESGKGKPRKDMKAKLIQLRRTGKREVKNMLKEIEKVARKPKVLKPSKGAPKAQA